MLTYCDSVMAGVALGFSVLRRRESTITNKGGRLEPITTSTTAKTTRGAGLGPIFSTQVGEETGRAATEAKTTFNPKR